MGISLFLLFFSFGASTQIFRQRWLVIPPKSKLRFLLCIIFLRYVWFLGGFWRGRQIHHVMYGFKRQSMTIFSANLEQGSMD
ncbi:hypothetical protein B0H63DRAFT_42525 [Podospora didyma]|uniref:Uncharacterized protein n=1 Tax=Podospora didyma TaxID=330526 RepID=A0AAE0P6N0_9PEZI|nr:hypothetical protein B0H63DRAFT_42525 [Podospora didyma]